MALVLISFLTEVSEDLEEYGEYSPVAGGKLDKALLKAMRDLWEKRDWSFKFSSGTITVTEGSQGPHTPPVGFESLVTAEAVSRYYDFDRFAVPASVPDGLDGSKYDILHDRLNNKLYFRSPPAAGTYTVYFRRALASTADITAWPDASERFLAFRTMHYALFPSQDLAEQADRFYQRSEVAFASMLSDLRRGESKQETREPRDVYGFPIAQSHANEGDGFLGGN